MFWLITRKIPVLRLNGWKPSLSRKGFSNLSTQVKTAKDQPLTSTNKTAALRASLKVALSGWYVRIVQLSFQFGFFTLINLLFAINHGDIILWHPINLKQHRW